MFLTDQYKRLWMEDESWVKDEIELYDFGGLEIPFSAKWGSVCINLSGGADSALVAAALCKIIQQNKFQAKVHAITLIKHWSTKPWQNFIAEEVFNKLKSMFPEIIEDHHKSFLAPEMEHSEVGNIVDDKNASTITHTSFNDFHCFFNEDVGAVFTGRTKNAEDLQDHPARMEARDNPDEERVVYPLEHSKTLVFSPILFKQKDWVVAQYFENGWEDLFNTTRSCQGKIENFDRTWKFKSGEHIPTCDKCYWCAERKWALGKINKS